MPLFGARMVCETGSYKHQQQTRDNNRRREENLGE